MDFILPHTVFTTFQIACQLFCQAETIKESQVPVIPLKLSKAPVNIFPTIANDPITRLVIAEKETEKISFIISQNCLVAAQIKEKNQVNILLKPTKKPCAIFKSPSQAPEKSPISTLRKISIIQPIKENQT